MLHPSASCNIAFGLTWVLLRSQETVTISCEAKKVMLEGCNTPCENMCGDTNNYCVHLIVNELLQGTAVWLSTLVDMFNKISPVIYL